MAPTPIWPARVAGGALRTLSPARLRPLSRSLSRPLLRPRSGPGTRSRPWLRVGLLASLCTLWAPAALAGDLEQRVKAAFLYNVAKFVDWPADPDGRLDVCLYGDTQFAELVAGELGDKRVAGRPVAVHALATLPAGRDCQMLYHGVYADGARAAAGLRALAGQPVLTIGEASDFLRQGGIMRLKRVEGKLRFEVKLAAVENSGLAISSKLLRLAQIVRDGEG